MRTASCEEEIKSDKYRTTVKTTRNVGDRSFEVEIDVLEREDARPVVPSEVGRPGPNSALDTSSESVWLSLSSRAEGSRGDSLRVGINPEGAYSVQLVRGRRRARSWHRDSN